MTSKLLITFAALAVVASTDAFAQRAQRPVEPGRGGQVTDPSKPREERTREQRKENPGLQRAGVAATQGDVSALARVVTKDVKGPAAAKINEQLTSLMTNFEGVKKLLEVVDAKIGEAAPAGKAVNNAQAVKNLLVELGNRGMLNEAGLTSSKTDLLVFLTREALSILQGTQSASFIDTVTRMTESAKQGKSIDDILFDGITENGKNKEEMERFCKACPGACK